MTEFLFRYGVLILFVVTMSIVIFFVIIDYKKPRKVIRFPKLSFMIPCYNDWSTVIDTIKSIQNSYIENDIQIIVINDNSDEATLKILEKSKNIFWYELVTNTKNLWKALSINQNVEKATGEYIFVVDADIVVNKKALHDVLARFQFNDKMWWVSCACMPINKWFLPAMQSLEYTMMSLIALSYNNTSALSLWWWFFAFRKEAFYQVWMLSLDAITEDMDLAFKLNNFGWKVQQSSYSVKTLVPDNIKKWYKQKLRWNAWWVLCYIKYFKIWIKKPLIVVLFLSFVIIIFLAAYNFFHTLVWFYVDISKATSFQWFLNLLQLLQWNEILKKILTKLLFTLLSFPYVIPLIKKFKHIYKIFYLVPYSLVYIPMYSVVWIIGMIRWIHRYIYWKWKRWW